MSALTLLFIRHAEKPDDDYPQLGGGFTENGTPDEESLVIRGWQRAGAWAVLFGSGQKTGDYPRPDVIFAASPTVGKGLKISKRPHQTVIPLSEKIGTIPDIRFPKGDEANLAKVLIAMTGVVLVCWEHKALVCPKDNPLIPAVLEGKSVMGVPSDWNDSRFDVVLRFDRDGPNSPWSFRQLFPKLLSGDSEKPL